MKKSRFGLLSIGTGISVAFTTTAAALPVGTGLEFHLNQLAIL